MFFQHEFCTLTQMFSRGGSCILQEPHGEYQHRLASMRV